MRNFFIDCRTVHFYRVDKGRNRGIILVFGAFPTRILKHRGWTNLIYQRAMVQAEIEMVQQCRRLVSYRYDDLGSLLIDELNTLGDNKDFKLESRALCTLYDTTIEAVFLKEAEA